ncbi:Predicted nuclease of the RNAse H fold, HicB family [Noviherbaspirillum humi]|uniref:Predicted nuclease of the RNAse H fold, HicB family n=1 Tax=Noviherbaspirillum humi TaxID=1688639 RepID=A0A239KRG8_9BURK|nr:type II toxin-antitoxin system HicB family antitoxin [Noviherbaspirillum humi]SNT20322.1 Predicted nuclease of the RNAse H fold, HicB family [Noviherbaspirillum humi]
MVHVPVFIKRTPIGDFTAVAPDIPGSFARGATPEEALQDMRTWLFGRWETLQSFGQDVCLYLSPVEGLIQDPKFTEGMWESLDIDTDQGTGAGPINLVQEDRRRRPRAH